MHWWGVDELVNTSTQIHSSTNDTQQAKVQQNTTMSSLFKKSDGKKLYLAAKGSKGDEVEVERLLKKGVKPNKYKDSVRQLCPPSAECAETPVTHPRLQHH
jgi:hypothetical protein